MRSKYDGGDEIEFGPCFHIEPGSPCDWDVCRQPERLAAGDRGPDPLWPGTVGPTFPNIDRIRSRERRP